MNERSNDPKKDTNETSTEISGGIHFHGRVDAPDSQFAGRDIINIGGDEINQLFLPLMEFVHSAPPEKQAEAEQKVEELKEEIAKGEQADDSRLAKIIDELASMLPGAISAIVSMFASPILSGMVGPVTQFVLQRLQGA